MLSAGPGFLLDDASLECCDETSSMSGLDSEEEGTTEGMRTVLGSSVPLYEIFGLEISVEYAPVSLRMLRLLRLPTSAQSQV